MVLFLEQWFLPLFLLDFTLNIFSFFPKKIRYFARYFPKKHRTRKFDVFRFFFPEISYNKVSVEKNAKPITQFRFFDQSWFFTSYRDFLHTSIFRGFVFQLNFLETTHYYIRYNIYYTPIKIVHFTSFSDSIWNF